MCDVRTRNHRIATALQEGCGSEEGKEEVDTYTRQEQNHFAGFKRDDRAISPRSTSTNVQWTEKRKMCGENWSEEKRRRRTQYEDSRSKRHRRRRFSKFENERDRSWEVSSSEDEYDCSDDVDAADDGEGFFSNAGNCDNPLDDNGKTIRQENNNASSSSSEESLSGSDSDDGGLCSTSSDSDESEDEIDLRFYRNPCPQNCACRSDSNMSEITAKLPRNELYRTVEPLYNRVLKSRLLRCSNLCVNTCCKHVCCKDWSRDRPSVGQIRKDYRPSNLRVTSYVWGNWDGKGS